MHRFRKKSDAKRSQVSEFVRSTPELLQEPQERLDQRPPPSLPGLPPESDFRTSLILPDLTRRFSLLRSASGGPLSLQELRSRITEQRARGTENQLTEEQEVMILETFRLRARHGSSSTREENSSADSAGYASSFETGNIENGRQSVRSTSTTNSTSLQSSPSSPRSSGRTGKRYSNNIFGSPRLRDYGYIRSVSSQRSLGSNRSALSATPTEASFAGNTSSSLGVEIQGPTSDSMRPSTPENGSTPSASVNSSPSEKTPLARPASLLPPTSSEDSSGSSRRSSTSESRPSKTFSSADLARMSVALEDVIREMEEEAEDEIVMPRSAPPVGSHNGKNGFPVHRNESSNSVSTSSGGYIAATALYSDKPVHSPDVGSQRNSPIPQSRSGATSPRLPGYIPGMPRPMTPRDTAMDSDDHGRPHSTTPRATSPMQSGFNDRPSPVISSNLAGGLTRRGSNASTSGRSPRVGSPLFVTRSTNGRFTPESKARNGDESFVDFDQPVDSFVPGPKSPTTSFSGSVYQRSTTSSRPGTPSNIRWNTSLNSITEKIHGRNGSISGHSRAESSTCAADTNSDIHGHVERSKSITRSLRSPALPDSPLLDGGHASIASISMSRSNGTEIRPPSSIPGVDLGSPIVMTSRALRSPTPTQSTSRSVVSPSLSEYDIPVYANGDSRSSTKSPPSSPFSFGTSNPLVFSPMANSSHSSLESAGSSYHSWDEEGKRDRVYGLFKDLDQQQPVWHDLSPDKSSSAALGSSTDDEWDPEEIIRRYAGLTKTDFVAIQEKIVRAAVNKVGTPESRPPSLRRRRPSTSHSVHAAENRATSPPPHLQNSVSSGRSSNSDSLAKASALLNSVIDSIQSPRTKTEDLEDDPQEFLPSPLESSSPSSPYRRNKDLADALFGSHDLGQSQLVSTSVPSSSEPGPSTPPEQTTVAAPSESNPIVDSVSPALDVSAQVAAITSPSQANFTSPRSPRFTNSSDLAREVQRRAEEATAALRKIPSNPRLKDNSGSTSRKRINPNQISSPHLVMASTSVDTIPLRIPSPGIPSPLSGQAQSSGTLKIGQRIRRIRGPFRSRAPVPNGEEITPFPLDLKPLQDEPSLGYDQSVPASQPPLSAKESNSFKVPIPSPPASAGPGLRGFMARFRKPRNFDLSPEYERRLPQPQPSAMASSVTLSPVNEHASHHHTQSAPPYNVTFPNFGPMSPRSPPSRPNTESTSAPEEAPAVTQPDEGALRQLFIAASDLGLDPEALNDFLVRSASTSSQPSVSRLNRNISLGQSSRSSKFPSRSLDRARSPSDSDGRPSLDSFFVRPNEPVTSKTSLRNPGQSSKSNDNSRKPGERLEDVTARNTIVRRTIIMPSDSRASAMDFSVLARKNSGSSRRRRPTSVTSAQSTRSVHDRAPTPPPKSAGGPRFSNDSSPPVPQIPFIISTMHSDSGLPVPHSAPSGPLEKSSSTYDSLYEMYADESKNVAASTTDPHETEGLSHSETAIEVVELANGETIWSIVNGLRDDDGESIFPNRASFLSEYSMHDSSAEGMQVFFKEHARKSSKGSNTSYISGKKSQHGQLRPETKVFYSSSAQIGRLIENLSRGLDAGSFNFSGNPPDLPGQPEPEMQWSMEERIEQMLGSMGHGS